MEVHYLYSISEVRIGRRWLEGGMKKVYDILCPDLGAGYTGDFSLNSTFMNGILFWYESHFTKKIFKESYYQAFKNQIIQAVKYALLYGITSVG